MYAWQAYQFELSDSMDQQAADSLHWFIERAFAPLPLEMMTMVWTCVFLLSVTHAYL